jgi:flagellar hook assembly protein FlgD
MQILFKTLLVGAILTIATSTALAADPVVGTWKLNLAKSTFSPGPAPKSQTRTYAESADGMTLTVKTTAADGKETTTTLIFKEDADFDKVSVTRVDALTVHSIQTKAGAAVGAGVRTVSKDGKTLTFAQKGTHATGGKYDDVSVYDKT